MAEEADDVHWKMDAVMLFMKSPEYTVPVMDFIDENCMVFDADEESKLEFSEVHGKFVETVFGLLEKFLAEIGVSQEEFSSVCQQQVMSGGKNAFVFQQIMAADDFQAFKKMMVQRNRQLSYENLKHLQRLQLAAGMSDGGQGAGAVAADAVGVVEEEGGEEDDEEHQMHEALRLSRMTFVDDDPELAEALRISAQESVTPDVPSSTSQAVGGEVAALTEAQAAGMSEDQLLQAAIQVERERERERAREKEGAANGGVLDVDACKVKASRHSRDDTQAQTWTQKETGREKEKERRQRNRGVEM